jgi:phage FluMu gp28-like protein
MRLLPYQQRWVEDTSRLKIMEKSRQIGMSWTAAYRLVREQAQQATPLDAWVTSRDETQARLFLEDCRKWASVLDLGAAALGQELLDTSGKSSSFNLRFANGRAIHSMSSNPDAQAGKRGSRVLDEFALHPDPHKLYAIAYPGITWGGSLEIISTHRGSQNLFNRLVEEVKNQGNPKGFSLHTVTLQDALDQNFLTKLKEKLPPEDIRQEMDVADYYNFVRAGCPDEETFLQEFCCIPCDDTRSFISFDLISRCEFSTKAGQPRESVDWHTCTGGPLFLGVDIGRDHDFTVFWLIEHIAGVSWTREVICLQDTPFSEQERQLDSLMKRHHLRRACIDQSGIGRQFCERARSRYGNHRVEGITFTLQVKEALAYPVRIAMANESLRFPEDPAIRADLRAVRRETTASGNIRFSAERGGSGHADRFWALALALHAAETPYHPHHYERLDRPARQLNF